MFKYLNSGHHPQVGDQVELAGDELIVKDIIFSEEDQQSWGLNEPGVMLEGKSFGLIFVSLSDEDLIHIK